MSETPDTLAHIAPSPARASLRALCPRCGAPGLFAGMLSLAPNCPACGLDFGAFNVGDGPAAIVTLVFGTIITVTALTVELAWAPPWWVHVLLWLPLTAVGVIASLRITKAGLIAYEYRNAAGEARRAGSDL